MMEHPSFGALRASVRRDRGRWLWEALDLVQTRRGDADLGFEAGASGPGPSHQAQLEEVIADLGPLTAAAAPMIDVKLGGWLDRSLGDDPWSELEWRGARLTGRAGDFQLHYSCRSWPDALVTVTFERRRPVRVQIDD
jgi:hypothetical protein